MESTGIVKEKNGNHITVTLLQDENCGSCDKCSSENKIVGEKEFITDRDVKEGDIIHFEIKNRYIFSLGVLIYFFPILSMILGYYISTYFTNKEPIQVLISILSLVISFFLIYFIDKKIGKNFLNHIKIKEC
ncbi:MAG: SoxR reducing system RseC family protein [Fusobacteriota bacterium]